MKGISKIISCLSAMAMLTACNGVLDGLYDEDTIGDGRSIFVDASSWKDWYYIDFHAIHDSIVKGVEPDLDFKPYAIPTSLTGEWDGESMICTYWYDVFGEGLQNNEPRGSRQADAQPEPLRWDIAIHRDNVRTNGGAVMETSLTDLASVDMSVVNSGTFVADEWNETDVWVDQSQMFSGVIGNQRIKMNKVLSGWLSLQIPPIPPTFIHNGHVFIVRFADNTYAAIRLADYRFNGTNCCMTIEYKYPLN